MNIDHLKDAAIREKILEMQEWLEVLEEERFDHEIRNDRQKYEVNHLRQRVHIYMSRSGKPGKSSTQSIKTHASVGVKAGIFK